MVGLAEEISTLEEVSRQLSADIDDMTLERVKMVPGEWTNVQRRGFSLQKRGRVSISMCWATCSQYTVYTGSSWYNICVADRRPDRA